MGSVREATFEVEALGVRAIRVSAREHLVGVLDEVMPTLRDRDQPLVVDVQLEAGETP